MAFHSRRLRGAVATVSSLLNHSPLPHPSIPPRLLNTDFTALSPPSPPCSSFSLLAQPYNPILLFQSRLFKTSSILCSRARSFDNDAEIGPDTILFEGCDYNHWLITMDFPKDPKPTPEQMVETYVQTCAKGLNISIEEAKKKIYACSTTTYNGFQAVMTEEESQKFEGLPGVVFILPDSYIDPVNKEYGGDKYINGTIIPRPPPIRPSTRYGDRNRNYDRAPRADMRSGPRNDFPQQNYGPPQQNYGPPQQAHVPPQQAHVPPQQGYGPPQPQGYGPPRSGYGQPQAQGYGPAQPHGYGPPQPQVYAPPQHQGYGGTPQPQGYGPPQSQGYGPPQVQGYGPPQPQGYGGPPQHQGHGGLPQPQGYGPPPQQGYGPPQPQGYGGPPPPQGYRPPQSQPPVYGQPSHGSGLPQQNNSPQHNFTPMGHGDKKDNMPTSNVAYTRQQRDFGGEHQSTLPSPISYGQGAGASDGRGSFDNVDGRMASQEQTESGIQGNQ